MQSSSEERELLRQRLSRRRLLKAGAVAAIGAAGMGLAACASESISKFPASFSMVIFPDSSAVVPLMSAALIGNAW